MPETDLKRITSIEQISESDTIVAADTKRYNTKHFVVTEVNGDKDTFNFVPKSDNVTDIDSEEYEPRTLHNYDLGVFAIYRPDS